MDLYVSAMTGSATLMMDKYVEVRSFNTATTKAMMMALNHTSVLHTVRTIENNKRNKLLTVL